MSYLIVTLFFVLTFTSLRISLYLSINDNGRIILSPVLLFTLLQTFMVNLGLLLTIIDDQNLYYKYLIILLSTFFFNLGALFVNKKKYNYTISNNTLSKQNKAILFIGFVLVCILLNYLLKDLLIGFFHFFSELISGNLISAISILAESRRTFSFSSGSTGIITEVKNIILVFLTIYIVASNFKWYLKLLVVIIASFFLLSSGQRWPLFEALLVYFIFITYSKNIKFNFKRIFSLSILIYFILFLTSYFQARFEMSDNFSDNIMMNIKSINYRLFVSQNMTTSYVFNLIPETLDYGMGSYIFQDFSTLLPGHQEGFSSFIYRITHSGKPGSASFSTLTLFFADFGVFGMFISFFYGLSLQYYCNLIFSKSISLHRLIFHSFVVLAVSTTSLGSLAGIVTHGLLSGFLMFYLCKLVLIKNKSFKITNN